MATRLKSKAKAQPGKLLRLPPSAPPDKALYLYGVSQPQGLSPAPTITVPGIDGEHPVRAIPIAGLLCWITRVDGREFAAELNRKMEELEWLAESSVRHQRVVAAIAERTTLLPTRFGTIF